MFTKNISAEIEIRASAARVWQTFIDFESYPDWNPFIIRSTGKPDVGESLDMSLQIPGGRKMHIRPRILTITPEKELRWLGQLWIPGLFSGDHRFLIRSLDDSSVGFVQEEQFRGLLVPFVGNWIGAGALRGFKAMNAALKHRVEKMQDQ